MLKAAVIGAGYLGRFHAEKYAKSSQAELAVVVDIDRASAAQCAKKNRCEALTDYHALPALGVQCASIVTPTSSHFAIASWLLQNGIDVLVEKPLCVTEAEALQLIDLAEAHNRILQVGHLERFNPAFRAMKEVLTYPMFFEVRRIAKFSGRSTDVDVILDLMIHDIDIVSHLIGRPVVKVEALGTPVITHAIDVANARIQFEGGAVANVSASRAAFASERSIRIFQPDVYISADYERRRIKIYRRGEKKTLFGYSEIEVSEHRVEEGDALRDEIEAFLTCVASRQAPEVGGADALRALQLAHLIRKSLVENLSLVMADHNCSEHVASAMREACQGVRAE